jgi:hypothetical protein
LLRQAKQRQIIHHQAAINLGGSFGKLKFADIYLVNIQYKKGWLIAIPFLLNLYHMPSTLLGIA